MNSLILGIDPSSHLLGICLFTVKGEHISNITCKSSNKNLCQRLEDLQTQVCDFIAIYEDSIKFIIYENNTFSPMQLWMSIAIVAVMLPNAHMSKDTGVFASQWKSWWRKQTGLPDKSPKGIKALKQLNSSIIADSDDSADSIILTSCWLQTYKGLTYE